MAFTIQYLKDGAEVAESPWASDMPPTRAFAKLGIQRRGADTAIIRDEVGNHLAVITEARRHHKAFKDRKRSI